MSNAVKENGHLNQKTCINLCIDEDRIKLKDKTPANVRQG